MKGGWRSWSIVSLTAFALAMLAIPPDVRTPVLIWNATPSAPIGLYRLVPDAVEIGRRVAVRPPDDIRELGVRLGVMRPDDLLIKTFAAGAGDVLCERNGHLERNGAPLGALVPHGYGPGLFGGGEVCRRLKEGEVLLLGDGSRSWDGRSFGLAPLSSVIGVVEPIGRL